MPRPVHCTYPGCELPITQNRAGIRKYCPEHAAITNRVKTRDRARAKRFPWKISDGDPPCCREAFIASGGKRTVCPQHKQVLKVKWKYGKWAQSSGGKARAPQDVGVHKDQKTL